MNDATFIGRCKRGCKGTVRLEAPVVEKKLLQLGYGRTERRTYRMLPNGLRVEGYDYFFATCLCGKSVQFQKMHGHKSDQPCSAKCTGATGNSCECACGGANHGAKFDVSVEA